MTNSPSDIVLRAQELTRGFGKTWDERLGRIMYFWVGPPASFPTKGKKKITSLADVDDKYLLYFIKRYYKEREGCVVMQPVSTRPDPVVDEVLKAYGNVAPENLERVCREHRLSMQAENIVGKLLERYVAPLLESRGWVWCAGETLRSVDFLKDENSDNVQLLQIKNRSNSENSSSKAIREGTKIQKWYRIDSKTGRTRWECLQENSENTCTEEGFYEFVKQEAKKQKPTGAVPLGEVLVQATIDFEGQNL